MAIPAVRRMRAGAQTHKYIFDMDDPEENVFHKIASNGSCFLRSHLSLFASDALLDKLHERNFEDATPLDVAIDYENRAALRIFIRYSINDETIVQAIGNFFSNYDFVGSSVSDLFIFQLILKKKCLSRQECNFLLRRAFDGNAWPFVSPLLHCSDLPRCDYENCFNWYVSEVPHMQDKTLSDYLAKERECCMPGNSIWNFTDDELRVAQSDSLYLNETSLLTFIQHRRKKMITRGMKDAVRKGKYSCRLIKRLMCVYK